MIIAKKAESTIRTSTMATNPPAGIGRERELRGVRNSAHSHPRTAASVAPGPSSAGPGRADRMNTE